MDTPTARVGPTAPPRFPAWFVMCCMLGAALVAADRWRFSIPVTYDMGIQLNGAQYLLREGRLLSDHFATQGPDLLTPPEPVPLTWFPGGFSMVISWMLADGLPLPIALKSLDSVCLAVGWLGWALAGAQLLAALGPLARWHGALACLLGFFFPFTLSAWAGGTEGTLWAISPWVALLTPWLFAESWRWPLASVGAGLLTGLALNFRYAAAYLALAWGLSIALLLRRNWRRALAAGLLFACVMLLCYAPVLLFNASAHHGGIAPPHDYQAFSWAFLLARLQGVLGAFTKSACLLGLAPLDARLDAVPAGPDRMLAGAILLVSLVATLALVGGAVLRDATPSRLKAWSLLTLSAGVTFFLVPPSLGMAYNALGDGRYYMPAIVAVPLLLLSLPALPRGRFLGSAALLGFAGVFLHDIALARKWDEGSFPLNQSAARSPIELCSLPTYWSKQLPWKVELEVLRPQFATDSFLAAARPFEAQHPDAIRFVQLPPYFQYNETHSPYRKLPRQEYWYTATAPRATELLIYVRNQGEEIHEPPPGAQPLQLSDHLKPVKLLEAQGWALFLLSVPASTPFFLHPVPQS